MPRDPVTRTELVLAGLVLPLAVLVPIWWGTATPALETGPRSDQLYYAAMAVREHAPARLSHTAPWCWRILTPWQVSLWPVGDDPLTDALRHFKTLAFASNWLSLILVYAILRRLGAGARARVFGVLAYAGIHWTIKFSFRAPGYVDFQMLTGMLAVLALMLAGRSWATLPLFALAAVQKEAALLLIPVVGLHRWRRPGSHRAADALWLAAALLVATVAVVAVRLGVPAANPWSGTAAVLRVVTEQLPDPAFWPRLLVAVFSGLGLLPLLLAWRGPATVAALRAEPWWALLVAVGALALLGGVDKARLFLVMAPAVVVVTVRVWEPALRAGGARGAAWAVVTLALHATLGHHFEPMGPPGAALARLAPVHSDASMWPSLVRIAAIGALWCGATALLLRRTARPA